MKITNQIHPSLVVLFNSFTNHNNLDELRFIYQTTDTEKVVVNYFARNGFEGEF